MQQGALIPEEIILFGVPNLHNISKVDGPDLVSLEVTQGFFAVRRFDIVSRCLRISCDLDDKIGAPAIPPIADHHIRLFNQPLYPATLVSPLCPLVPTPNLRRNTSERW